MTPLTTPAHEAGNLPAPSAAPLVSIVMATFNRSNIIGFAIDMIRRSSIRDWELLVIGDCCTDDTADVIEAIGDERIRFVNLPENYGEQTGPNNVGMGLAKGRFIALMNHDDLCFPHHLEQSIRLLEERQADLTFDQGLAVLEDQRLQITGATCATVSEYSPWMTAGASLWVMRREVHERVGPWRHSSTLRGPPSQEWLRRAAHAGCRILANPVPGVLILPSMRKNSYRDRLSEEHCRWHAWMCTDQGREAITGMAMGYAVERRALLPGYNLGQFLNALGRRLLMACKIQPPTPRFWLSVCLGKQRRGALMPHLHRIRGLHRTPGPDTRGNEEKPP